MIGEDTFEVIDGAAETVDFCTTGVDTGAVIEERKPFVFIDLLVITVPDADGNGNDGCDTTLVNEDAAFGTVDFIVVVSIGFCNVDVIGLEVGDCWTVCF